MDKNSSNVVPDLSRLEAKAEEAASLLRSMGSPHRLMVLCTLLEGERSVGGLQERLALSASNLSQHLARLREEGLVSTRREGTVIYYRVSSDRVQPLVEQLYNMFCGTV